MFYLDRIRIYQNGPFRSKKEGCMKEETKEGTRCSCCSDPYSVLLGKKSERASERCVAISTLRCGIASLRSQ
jgi:hypothetical protein